MTCCKDEGDVRSTWRSGQVDKYKLGSIINFTIKSVTHVLNLKITNSHKRFKLV
jgi:hypothetical protein